MTSKDSIAVLEKQLEHHLDAIGDIRKQISSLKEQMYDLKGGNATIYLEELSVVEEPGTATMYTRVGLERATTELAQRALKNIIAYLRILAYVDEHCPEWTADWEDLSQQKFLVEYAPLAGDGHAFQVKRAGLYEMAFTPYMNKETAEKLAADLNSGRFSLEAK